MVPCLREPTAWWKIQTDEQMSKLQSVCPGWRGSVGWSIDLCPKDWVFNSQSGHTPRLWVWSLVQACMGGKPSMFLSFPSSPSRKQWKKCPQVRKNKTKQNKTKCKVWPSDHNLQSQTDQCSHPAPLAVRLWASSLPCLSHSLLTRKIRSNFPFIPLWEWGHVKCLTSKMDTRNSN